MESDRGTSESTARPLDNPGTPRESTTPPPPPNVSSWMVGAQYDPNAAPRSVENVEYALSQYQYIPPSVGSSSAFSGYSSSQGSGITMPDVEPMVYTQAAPRTFVGQEEGPFPPGQPASPSMVGSESEDDFPASSPNVSSQSTASGSSDYQSESQEQEAPVSQESQANLLPCILMVAGHCNRTFDPQNKSDWMAHISHHFGHRYPPSSQCGYCGEQFGEVRPFPTDLWDRRQYGRDSEKDGRNKPGFRKFLRHIAAHFEQCHISGAWNPGFDVIRFMLWRHLIENDQYYYLTGQPLAEGDELLDRLGSDGVEQENAYYQASEYAESAYPPAFHTGGEQ